MYNIWQVHRNCLFKLSINVYVSSAVNMAECTNHLTILEKPLTSPEVLTLYLNLFNLGVTLKMKYKLVGPSTEFVVGTREPIREQARH